MKFKIDATELSQYMTDYIGQTETVTDENSQLVNTVFNELIAFIEGCQEEPSKKCPHCNKPLKKGRLEVEGKLENVLSCYDCKYWEIIKGT